MIIFKKLISKDKDGKSHLIDQINKTKDKKLKKVLKKRLDDQYGYLDNIIYF